MSLCHQQCWTSMTIRGPAVRRDRNPGAWGGHNGKL